MSQGTHASQLQNRGERGASRWPRGAGIRGGEHIRENAMLCVEEHWSSGVLEDRRVRVDQKEASCTCTRWPALCCSPGHPYCEESVLDPAKGVVREG